MKNVERIYPGRLLPLVERSRSSQEFTNRVQNIYLQAHHLVVDVGTGNADTNTRSSGAIELGDDTIMYYNLVLLKQKEETAIGVQRKSIEKPENSRIVVTLFEDRMIDWEGRLVAESPAGCLIVNDVLSIVDGIYTLFYPPES